MKKTIVSLAAGFLLAGAAATSVSAQEYKVQEGDTLSGIGHEHNVSVDDLKAWNDLDSDFIVVNQLLDIQNEDASDNAENQDVAPADEQAQQEAPVKPSDDQATDEESDQEADQPEADEEEETQPEADPSDDQGAEQEDSNAEEPQQEANDEAVENNEDEAVEQEQANEEPAEEQEPQEVPDDQAAEQNEDNSEANQSEENDEETTNDEDKDQDADSEEGETMTMSSTAYTAGCEGCSGTTADGTELSGDENVVAVDPDKIPIGSEVHVEGYGNAIAADTGGDINDDRIDLHMGDEGEATDWGRQDVEVTVK